MDFFSYQYQSSLFDSVYPPNLPMKLTSSLEGDIGSFSLLHYPSSSLHASISTEHCMTSPITENQFSSVPLVENHTLSYSSGCNFAQQKNGTDNKRKNRDDKDAKEAQRKKQWKYNTSSRDSGEKLKPENNQKKSSDEPPSGYIHVRARRGQATDNHSLAERVRREKISQRMKLLQGLVPGCDKVTGKALMLDEIINYVQSLQNQVKFLSMKLASFCPDFFDFGADSEGHMPQSETRGSLPSQSQSVQQNPQLENATSALAHGQTPVNSAFPQDNANLLLEGEHQVEGFLTRDNFNDSCYF